MAAGDEQWHRLGGTFDGDTSEAIRYDAVRPGYAPAALDWVLPRRTRDVLDLGAGTGKLTAMLLARGLHVVAVEPATSMLAVLAERHPTVPAHLGGAEEIPLDDASVDAVLAGAAFHWFDRPNADLEIARVLRPGGRVGLLWNHRDPDFPLNGVFDEALRRSGAERPDYGHDVTLAPERFGPTERAEFEHTETLPEDRLVDLLATRSYVLAMPEPDRQELLVDVAERIARLPGLPRAGDGSVRIPYVTEAVRARLR